MDESLQLEAETLGKRAFRSPQKNLRSSGSDLDKNVCSMLLSFEPSPILYAGLVHEIGMRFIIPRCIIYSFLVSSKPSVGRRPVYPCTG